MAKNEWNRTSAKRGGQIKNVRKEYNKMLSQNLKAMQEGQQVGQGFQDFRADVDQTMGTMVGSAQPGTARDAMAAGQGYSGFQQEAARQAGEAQMGQTASLLSQYKKQQDQAAMARNQAAVSGLQYERAQRAAQRAEVIDTMQKVGDIAATQAESFAEVWGAVNPVSGAGGGGK